MDRPARRTSRRRDPRAGPVAAPPSAGRLGLLDGPVQPFSRLSDESVERLAVLALGALLQLGVDVHRHLRVGVADLTHDPQDVEAVGEQRDRDVGAPQACAGVVFGSAGRPRAARWLDASVAASRTISRRAGGSSRPPRRLREQVGVRVGRQAGAPQPVDVRDELLEQVGADLDLADAGFGLGVGDAEVRAARGVQAQVADADVAQLADAHAGAAERRDDRAPTDVVRRVLRRRIRRRW